MEEKHGDVKENQMDMSSVGEKTRKAQLILLKAPTPVFQRPADWNRCCCRCDRLWKMNQHFPLSSRALCADRNHRALSAGRMRRKRERKSWAEYLNRPDKETVQARQQVKSKTRVGYNKYVDITVWVNYAFSVTDQVKGKHISKTF